VNDEIQKIVKEINEKFFGTDYDFVPTIGGRGQHHPHGMVGNMWRIKNPESVNSRMANCFLRGRLKKNDLFLCTRHSGDCCQDYIFIKEYSNCYIAKPEWRFGSYGIGDAKKIKISSNDFKKLKNGGRVDRKSFYKKSKGATK